VLTDHETEFITTRCGFIALEMIRDTNKTGTKDEIHSYSNSESVKPPNSQKVL